MPWRAVNRSDSGSLKIDWSALQRFPALDPYIVWQDLTSAVQQPTGQNAGDETPTGAVCALLEFASEGAALAFWIKLNARQLDGLSATHTGHVFPQIHRFASLMLPSFAFMAYLLQQVGQGELLRIELVASRSGLLPGGQAAFFLAVEEMLLLSKPKLQPQRQGKAGAPTLESQLQAGLKDIGAGPSQRHVAGPSGPLVTIVDDGFNFASHRFRDAGQAPRLFPMMWDQSPPPSTQDPANRGRPGPYRSTHWEAPYDSIEFTPVQGLAKFKLSVGALYGQRLMLGRLLAAAVGEPDQAIYAMARYLRETPAWTHGVSMMDLALNGTLRPATSRGVSKYPKQPLLVQLPERTVEDTSGGSLAGHALDAIHHALYVAGDRPIIVNLSYGTHSGPHDGSSMFERALKELLDKHENLHVVLPAGNTHLARCHASCYVGHTPQTRQFLWKVLADDPTDSYLEIWLSSASAVVRVTSPTGHGVVAQADSVHLMSEGEVVQAALVYPKAVAQGHAGTMALLALAPTRRTEQSLPDSRSPWKSQTSQGTRKAILAPHGVWTVDIENYEPQCTRVDLWVQRDDAAPGGRRARNGFRGRQSYLLESDGHSVEPRTTISGIATLKHDRLFVVGAMRLGDYSLSPYSAAGPNRSEPSRPEGPDLVVVADESRNLPGMITRRTQGGGALRVSGTSVAAARVTRMLFEYIDKHGSAKGFAWTEPATHTPSELRAAGAPEPAGLLFRGEWNRMWEPDLLPPDCSRS